MPFNTTPLGGTPPKASKNRETRILRGCLLRYRSRSGPWASREHWDQSPGLAFCVAACVALFRPVSPAAAALFVALQRWFESFQPLSTPVTSDFLRGEPSSPPFSLLYFMRACRAHRNPFKH